MNSLIRVAAVSNRIKLGNLQTTTQTILSIIEQLKPYSPDICLFPAYALTGSQVGSLAYHKSIIYQSEDGISQILKQTKNIKAYIVIGSLLFQNGVPTNAVYVLREGEIKAILTEKDCDFVFAVRDIKFNILSQPIDRLAQYVQSLSSLGTDLTLLPSCNYAVAGSTSSHEQSLSYLSKAIRCGLAVANGGVGDTSFPYLSKGFSGCFECGTTLSFKSSLQNSIFTISDFDCDIIRAEKAKANLPLYNDDFCDLANYSSHNNLLRIVEKDPYLPKNETEKENYLLDLFQLQSASLAARLENTHINKVVIGISGGLDSTLALLVCCNAFTALDLPRKDITAITMQGFGTSGSTYENALELMRSLGCTIKEIPIRDSVLQHFADIGQDPSHHDVTYENAQARERTQILLDVANQLGALVVGTGDLSEEALGFATFSGDHMSNFNVNTCVTKTMIRKLVTLLAKTSRFQASASVLQKILDTPIRPELLPPDENGSISQKTEEILGPYELHDFFLYYFIKYHFTPEKIYRYAEKAFQNEFQPAYIKEKLAIFLKRFCFSQFKRSCSPDSSVITELNLLNAEFSMPSDIGADLFLQELEQL